jgi:hypothetical protein
VPWEGMREFTVQQDGKFVNIRGQAAYNFNSDVVKYSEDGKALSVYHRAKPE